MSQSLYGNNFYKDRHAQTLYAAVNILTLVSEIIPTLNSAADFGCGVGTWLQVSQKLGAGKILGFEGKWLDKKMLVISEGDFIHTDLSRDFSPTEKYDLAISLEVAEHIQEEYARIFVERLTRTSDFILFSAAIPFQKPGPEHVNEQWPHYWINLFNSFGFKAIDCIRGYFWNDPKIPSWYRQNIMLYVKSDKIEDLNLEKIQSLPNLNGLALVHPDYFYEALER